MVFVDSTESCKRLILIVGYLDNSSKNISPDTQRDIVNQYARVWDTEVTDWIPGKIVEASTSSVTLELENGEKKEIDFSRIAKAKLLNT